MQKYFQRGLIIGLFMISACQTVKKKEDRQKVEISSPYLTAMNYSCIFKFSDGANFLCIEYQNFDEEAKNSCSQTSERDITPPTWQNSPCANADKTDGCFLGTNPKGPSTIWYYSKYYYLANIAECRGTRLSYQGSDKGQLPDVKLEQQYFKTGSTNIWDKKVEILVPFNSFTGRAIPPNAPEKTASFSWAPSANLKSLSVITVRVSCSTFTAVGLASHLTLDAMNKYLPYFLQDVTLNSQVGSANISPNGASVYFFNGELSGQSVIASYAFFQSPLENGDAGLVCGSAVYFQNEGNRQNAVNMSNTISNSMKCDNCL